MESQFSERTGSTRWKHLQTIVSMFRLPARRVPVLMQMSSVECGAACLAMILSYYGRHTSVSEVSERSSAGRDGLSALQIVGAARDYGLRVRALSLQQNDFRCVHLPAIIHWEFDHFVVVERWSPTYVEIIDPAAGRLRITAKEFENSFTGIVILLEPGLQFIRHHPTRKITVRTYIANCFKQAPWVFVQVLAASLLLQLFGLSVPLLTKVVVDHVVPVHIQSVIMLLGIGILVLVLSQLVTTLLRALLLVYIQARVDMYMIAGFFEHLLALPLRFFQQRASGDILARLTSNTVIRDTLSNQLVSAILDGACVIVYLVILFWLSRVFGLVALALGLLQVFLLLFTNRQLRHLSMHELIAQGRMQSYVNETLVGIVSLKAAGAEQRAFQHWSNLFCDQLNASVRRNTLSSLVDTMTSFFGTLAPLVVLWIGMIQVLNGTMPIGTMLGLNALVVAFLTPLAALVSSGQRLQLVHSHIERLADVLEAEPEQQPQFVHHPPKLTGQITLENVSFRYGAQSPDVLKTITLHIEPGQKVALVGRTGSGKSTLGKLLLGLYPPTQGQLLYDGIPLHYLNYQAVRAQFGVVMQEATIYSGTIRQNIAFNDPDMDMEQIMHAARLSAFHDDILSMPMGYETFISEQGSGLSGGQRQRLALARALAHKPTLLLLDEATSALDTVTEQIVEQNVTSLACTQIIIAHRLSTIRNADIILVLDEGKLVEQGTHRELLHRQGYYAALVQSQMAGNEADVR